ncbi:MAG: M28 family peptidase [Planctomycetota bacterium]
MKVFSCVVFSYLLVTPYLAVADESQDMVVSRLKEDLYYLADDAMKGRDSGSEGIREAGEFIAKRFRDLGIKTNSFDGTPFQNFGLPGPLGLGKVEDNSLNITTDEETLELELGEAYNSLTLGNSGKFSGEVVYAGYGITAPRYNYDDYANIDVEGKIVIVVRKEPQQSDPNSKFMGTENTQFAYFSSKEFNAAQHKAAAMILVNDKVTAAAGDEVMEPSSAGAAQTRNQIPTLFCKRSVIDPIVKKATGKSLDELEDAIDADATPQSEMLEGVKVEGQTEIVEQQLKVRNVIGVLEGKGNLAEEYIVVGAHYDHVGMGGRGSLAPGTIAVHNGADDNGSGTVTLMEVAKRMAADESENRRTILFMAFTAEEKGLLGSKHYVRNPRWPLENTVAMINMDMVGRLTNNRLTVYGTGTAKEFDGMIDRLNETSKFALDKRIAGFGPSDHSSFYEAEIPVFHFFTGLHNDYHRPSDDPDTVNYEGMARVATMITESVKEISTAEKRPSYVKITGYADVGRGPTRSTPAPRPKRAVMSLEMDLLFSEPGVKIKSVTAGGPAADSGLQAEDIMTAIDGTDIERVRDLRSVLQDKKPGDKIKIKVKRGEEEMEVELELAEG